MIFTKYTTGIVRNLDQLGRICLPKELRRSFDMEDGAPICITPTKAGILLTKQEKTCAFCEETKGLIEFQGRFICSKCLKSLENLHLQSSSSYHG